MKTAERIPWGVMVNGVLIYTACPTERAAEELAAIWRKRIPGALVVTIYMK